MDIQEKRGQSTTEYFILIAGVLIVLIALLNPNGIFRNRVEVVLNDSVDMLETMTDNVNFQSP